VGSDMCIRARNGGGDWVVNVWGVGYKLTDA
jgi:hypothetical protein